MKELQTYAFNDELNHFIVGDEYTNDEMVKLLQCDFNRYDYITEFVRFGGIDVTFDFNYKKYEGSKLVYEHKTNFNRVLKFITLFEVGQKLEICKLMKNSKYYDFHITFVKIENGFKLVQIVN